ncbi:hypothetical protein NDU88_004488 [Pleurodeles waltl]|uniref:Uncharacterized protein n=1 Tax=Pleurodeles waltl TaxID=8319 RepID=A0AAV7NMD7_PLEWA|nr:hypothetical protein NDU88_004488 [Pleurodeles waltl]
MKCDAYARKSTIITEDMHSGISDDMQGRGHGLSKKAPVKIIASNQYSNRHRDINWSRSLSDAKQHMSRCQFNYGERVPKYNHELH